MSVIFIEKAAPERKKLYRASKKKSEENLKKEIFREDRKRMVNCVTYTLR